MRSVEPSIFLVAETKVSAIALTRYLEAIGAQSWDTDARSDAELLLEVAGRGCYRSFAPGLNKNVTRIREGNHNYLQNIVRQEHGSVFEHASATFIFHNVSRVFTHELVRHRVGVGMSQESMRYVQLEEIPMWMPSIVANDPKAADIFREAVEADEKYLKALSDHFRLNDPAVPFEKKKEITSAIRRIAPGGIGTMIMWTANFRIMRHVLAVRTAPGAEEEIRLVFAHVGAVCKEQWPAIFADFYTEDHKGIPWFKSEYAKI